MRSVCDVPFCGRPDCQHGIDDHTLDPAKWAKSELMPKMGGGAAREHLDLDIRLSLIENLKLYSPVAVLEILAQAHPNTAWSGTSASPSAGLVHFSKVDDLYEWAPGVATPARRLKCPQCFPRHGTFYNADETACWRGCGVDPVEA